MDEEQTTTLNALTPHGFHWGPMEVIRSMTFKNRRLLEIKTAYHTVSLVVSPNGRSVHVFMGTGTEMKEMVIPDE